MRRRQQDERHFPTWSVAFGDVDPTSTDSVEMPPPQGPEPRTATEAAFIRDLLTIFDP